MNQKKPYYEHRDTAPRQMKTIAELVGEVMADFNARIGAGKPVGPQGDGPGTGQAKSVVFTAKRAA